jgi:hypothetical protein
LFDVGGTDHLDLNWVELHLMGEQVAQTY